MNTSKSRSNKSASRAQFSLLNPCDRGFFSTGHILRDGQIPQCGGLPLSRTHHPLQKPGECTPLGVVLNMRRNNNPCKGADGVYTRTWSIHDRDLEVTADFDRVAYRGSDTFKTGCDKFAVSISNPAIAQMVLKGVDEFNIPDGAATLFHQFRYAVVPLCLQSCRPFRSQARTDLDLPIRA